MYYGVDELVEWMSIGRQILMFRSTNGHWTEEMTSILLRDDNEIKFAIYRSLFENNTVLR
jgi:hypothetical protein